MHSTYLVYAIFGAVVLVLALAASIIKEKIWLSEPLLAMVVGIAAGPLGFNLVDPAQWGDQERILEELARITLAISLMGVAFRLPNTWIRDRWRPLAVVLLVLMPLMWLVSSFLSWQLLGLPLLQALLLGAIITPTDPVVADSILTGDLAEESIDKETRDLISAESGANDGLAYLLVMLPALLLARPVGEALWYWGTVVLLGEVLGSILGGAFVGWLAGWVLKAVYRYERSHHGSILAVSLALAVALLGFARLLHGDGILAVFAAGLAFNWIVRDEASEEAEHERMQETVTRFFEAPVFLFFGMVLPWQEWMALGSAPWLFAAAVLLFRRLPAMLLLGCLIGPLRHWRDALFAGWFGPVAVAAMFYATWADTKQQYTDLWVLGSLVIFSSIVVHGITATPFTRWYGRARAAGRRK